jgi:hypothetical protein
VCPPGRIGCPLIPLLADPGWFADSVAGWAALLSRGIFGLDGAPKFLPLITGVEEPAVCASVGPLAITVMTPTAIPHFRIISFSIIRTQLISFLPPAASRKPRHRRSKCK